MRNSFITTMAVATMAMFASSAQAEIDIDQAKIQQGQVFVSGSHAQKGAAISWEGVALGINSTNGGAFQFNTTNLPADCVGLLTIGTEQRDVVISNCTANITVIQGGVLKTGQTTSYVAGDDGDLEKGVASPNPRFTKNVNAANDNGAGGGNANNGICDGSETCNGTVTDNLTGLIWLQKLDCLGAQTWFDAFSVVNTLADGNVACGLTDGSVAGDWRLPNRNELASLIDLENRIPALPAAHPFTNFFGDSHWSSTTDAGNSGAAWIVDFFSGAMGEVGKTTGLHVTPVRGGS
jgi:hypothetical protein